MATSDIAVTEGSGKNLATNSISEDAITKELSRVVPNNSAGTEIGTSSNPIQVSVANTGANSTAVKVDASSVAVPITDNSGSITVDNNGTFATQATLQTGSNAIGKLAANSGVDIGDVDVTSVIAGTGATNLGKAEDGAHTSGDTGVMSLGVRNDALAAFSGTDLDYTPIGVTKEGRVINTLAPSAAMVRGTATTTGTSDTSLVAASGDAGLKTYITAVQVVNTGSTTSLITLKDGSGGSTLAYIIAPTGGGAVVNFPIPLVTTANTALYFAAASASTTIYASAQGYKAP